MSTHKAKKGKSTRSSSTRTAHQRPDEVNVLSEVGGDFVSKDAYFALKRAFDNIKRKYIAAVDENKKLQDFSQEKIQEITFLREKLEFTLIVAEENKELNKKLQLGFQAFDEKYKESERLKKELNKFKKEIEEKKAETERENDQDEVHDEVQLAEEDITLLSNPQTNSVEEAADTKVHSSTQTATEKSDQVELLSDHKNLLTSCGLEIVSQDQKPYLILVNRDHLKQWLENETDCKVSVAFEVTPVFERFVQTELPSIDFEVYLQGKVHTEECKLNQEMIIRSKQKIVDQADEIQRYRKFLNESMTSRLEHSTPQKTPSRNVMVQTQESSNTEADKVFFKYRQSIRHRVQQVLKQVHGLQTELEYQKNYSKRLNIIISRAAKKTSKNIQMVTKATYFFPIEYKSEGRIKTEDGSTDSKNPGEEERGESQEDSCHSVNISANLLCESGSDPPLSMPVQETENSSLPSSLIDETLRSEPDTQLSSTENVASVVLAGVGLPEVAAEDTLVADSIPHPSTRETTIQVSQEREYSAPSNDYDEEACEGGATGVDTGGKECPMCFILYNPSTSQQTFEAHVEDHFRDG